ncbi:PAS domain S-box protein [Desulfovibrio mangrovi]|uniref:sensor histidine kinase n=1 Tax=Desulfovibrio mangrovi TaxID=2976983 RepID=UPI0022474542|nr:PAS domain S-box protein [Desulfovibrio mangrovi]UZP67250.1 PAS domain S-box protein [Desulfovibrio mangrovi]
MSDLRNSPSHDLVQELERLKQENARLRGRNDELAGTLACFSQPIPVVRSIANNVKDAIMVLDEEGRIITGNPLAAFMFGEVQDTFGGQVIHDLLGAADAGMQAFTAAVEGNGCVITEQQGLGLKEWRSAPLVIDGKRLILLGQLDVADRFSLRQGNLQLQALLEERGVSRSIALRQILERQRAEEMFRREQGVFQLILDTDPSYISVYDAEGQPRLVNRAFSHLFGFREELPLAEQFRQSAAARQFACDRTERVCRTGTTEYYECEVEDDMGTFRWYDAVITPLETPSGETLALSIATDVTERKVSQLALEQAHSELEERVKERTAALAELNERLVHEAMERLEAQRRIEESEARFKSLFFTNQAIKLLVDRESLVIREANNAALQFYGYTREEMIGLPVTALTMSTEELIRERQGGMSREGSAHFEARHRLKNGRFVDVEVYSGSIEGEMFKTIFAIVHDISERKKAERLVIEQRNHLTALMNALADSAMLLDVEGTIITLNTAAATVLGGTEEELAGVSLFDKVLPVSEKHMRAIMEKVRETGQPLRQEYASGDSVWDVTCNPVLDIMGNVGGLALYGKDVSARKKAEERMRWLSARVLSAQEEERKRIGRELHDSTAQMLSGIKFMMEADLSIMERAKLPHDTRAIRKVVSLLQGAIIELRRIIMDLRPTVLDDLGLLSALRWLQDEFCTMHSGTGFRLLLEMDEDLLSEVQKSVLFRVAQEAIANAVRHSRADALSLSLVREGDYCSLVVSDNGVGFDPRELVGAGIGLDSMRERLELVEGQLHISSEKGIGTQVKALVPIRKHDEMRDQNRE